MVFEKDFLGFMQSRPSLNALVGSAVFYEEAPQGQEGAMLVLQSIYPGGAREIDVHKPLMQIDCFEATQFKALELAEALVTDIQGFSGVSGESYIQSVRAERRGPIRCEDGTWKVPVEARFSCRRK